VGTILSRIGATSERDGARVRDDLTEIGDRYDPVALHSVRRRIRELRYAAELEEALQGRTPGSSATWKALQDAIGTLHDAHLLAEWMGRRSEWAANRDRRELSATAAAERELFESEARRRHAELLEMRPLELVASALSAL